ncbi:MAG: hypothetical protein AAGB15_01920, partial [Pseudomonadota bacterium]
DVMRQAGDTAKRHGKAAVTFQATPATVPALREMGLSMFCVGSEHSLLMGAAKQVMADLKA